jgi:chorismate mutase
MSEPSLAQLRQEIDEIDTKLHDLIMQRAEVVEAIRAVKPGGVAIRPARQAQILRRLLGRHQGSLPRQTIAAVWREMLGAFTAVQSDFTIVTAAGLADLARREYGDAATIRISATPLEAVRSGAAALAILPFPSHQQTWWRDLAASPGGLSILAALPFAAAPEAVAIGAIAYEPSGDDCSLIAAPQPQIPFEHCEVIAQSGEMRLFRIKAYIAAADARLDRQIVLLGGYPSPLQ